jgi:hypothetical protein
MKETNIDCMKYRKSTHLAGIDVETIISEKGNCILTIKEAYYNKNVDVSGNKTDGYFIDFVENVKPMVVNSINRKVISELLKKAKNLSSADSRNIGNWSNFTIELTFDENVKMMGKTTGGIRVKNQLPTIMLPILERGDIFDKCKVAIQSGNYTIEQIKTKYQVSVELEKELLL